MDNSSPSMLKAALIGGAVFGLIGAIPCISAINLFCCALVIAGGFLAAYLYSGECKRQGVEFRAGGGAKVGLVAGIFYWIVNSIGEGLMRIVVGAPDLDEILDRLESADLPPEVLDIVEQAFELMGSAIGVVIGVGVLLIVSLVFSMIGGLIGGAVFKVEAPPPAPPTSSAPPPPPPVGP
jgi:hypothetical protein